MNFISRRFSHVMSKPEVTGSGPFISEPLFTILGSPRKSVKVDLPRMSVLCTKDVTVSVLNGDVESFATKAYLSNVLNYLETVSHTPSSFIISSTGLSANFHMLRSRSGDVWRFPKATCFTAWSGLSPVYDELSSMFLVKGKSQIVLNALGPLYHVELSECEDVSVPTNAVIGYTAFRYRRTENPKPKTAVGILESIKQIHWTKYFKNFGKATLATPGKDILTFTGPGVLLISDRF